MSPTLRFSLRPPPFGGGRKAGLLLAASVRRTRARYASAGPAPRVKNTCRLLFRDTFCTVSMLRKLRGRLRNFLRRSWSVPAPLFGIGGKGDPLCVMAHAMYFEARAGWLYAVEIGALDLQRVFRNEMRRLNRMRRGYPPELEE